MSKTKVYEGKTIRGEKSKILLDGKPFKILGKEPPEGFEWGVACARTDLALHILADCVGPEIAVKMYQNFHEDKVAKFTSEWAITSGDIHHWLQSYDGVI